MRSEFLFIISLFVVALNSTHSHQLHPTHLTTIFLPTRSISKTMIFYKTLFGMEFNHRRERDQHHDASIALGQPAPPLTTHHEDHHHHTEFYFFRDLEVPSVESSAIGVKVPFRLKMVPFKVLPASHTTTPSGGTHTTESQLHYDVQRITFSVSCQENIHQIISHLNANQITILEGPIANSHQEIQIKVRDPSGNSIWLMHKIGQEGYGRGTNQKDEL
mmetsp:Transcript_802/g.2726  ORF Transcript_802/g.2726 Transcript_802/m.2726 type:complete len:218 (+) Transcript_802:66-719(+)